MPRILEFDFFRRRKAAGQSQPESSPEPSSTSPAETDLSTEEQKEGPLTVEKALEIAFKATQNQFKRETDIMHGLVEPKEDIEIFLPVDPVGTALASLKVINPKLLESRATARNLLQVALHFAGQPGFHSVEALQPAFNAAGLQAEFIPVKGSDHGRIQVTRLTSRR